jgi:hypothetical protein
LQATRGKRVAKCPTGGDLLPQALGRCQSLVMSGKQHLRHMNLIIRTTARTSGYDAGNSWNCDGPLRSHWEHCPSLGCGLAQSQRSHDSYHAIDERKLRDWSQAAEERKSREWSQMAEERNSKPSPLTSCYISTDVYQEGQDKSPPQM